MARTRSDTSVIVSAHNAPGQLRLVLLALARQTVLPAEVLIADDGSPESMPNTLQTVAPTLPFRLVYVRQPHDGFRLARSRNNAIHHARGEFIVFLDQDTLPHATWLDRHLATLMPGRVCTGHVLRLSEQASARLTGETVSSGEFEAWHDPVERRHLDGLQRKYAFYVVMRRLGLGIKGRPAIAFGNAAACRADLLKVNGFDEEYIGWGQEDDDLGWRLYFAGVRPVALVNRALVSHIYHPPRHGNWKTGANIERYRRTRASAVCARGLSEHPHPDVTVAVFDRAGGRG